MTICRNCGDIVPETVNEICFDCALDRFLQYRRARKLGSTRPKCPVIPKSHPLLPYSANVMLRDCRAILARELRRQRKIRRFKSENRSERL